jgi:hypothetical protein
MIRTVSLVASLLAFSMTSLLPASARADETQAEFEAAMQAVDQKRWRTARQRLAALLAANPSLARARLELARVHYLNSDYSAARAEAQRVLDDPNTPPSVRTTVLAFLAQIDADEGRFAARHQWSPSLYAGLMYDSNVNIGPSRDVIDTGTFFCTPVLPCSVNENSRPQEDLGLVVSPGIVHTWNPGKRFDAGEERGWFLWQSQANAYYRAYFDENDFNLGVLTLRTGPAWVVPGKWRASIDVQADQIFLGDESLALYTGLNPALTLELNANAEVTFEGNVTNRHYWEDDEDGRDGWYKSLSILGTRWVADRRLGFQLGAGWVDFDADDDQFGYRGPDLIGGILWEAWNNGLVYARLNYRGYDFDGIEDLFLETRDDDEWRGTIGFQHDFQSGFLRDWSLLGSWVHTDNESNIGIYDYDRDVLNLGLSRRF